MFTVPFVLVFCDVLNPEKCYYLWLQEYIQVRLNYENPNWRKQQTNTLYFPPENILGTKRAEEHLAYISGFPKFKESWIKYYISIDELNSIIPKTFYYRDKAPKIVFEYSIQPMKVLSPFCCYYTELC